MIMEQHASFTQTLEFFFSGPLKEYKYTSNNLCNAEAME